ncbi:MAG: transposase, partial [Candidatus Omnitrophota bacterium]
MDNHVHFICVPRENESMAKVFSSAHMRYSQYYNKKLKANGHLWQGRFYSCVLEHEHINSAVRYVERNPVRAGLVKKAWKWEWSSAAFHAGETGKSVVELSDMAEIMNLKGIDWKEYVTDKDDPQEMDEIRKCTMLGRPWGGSGFTKALSKILGFSVSTRKKGRPRKKKIPIFPPQLLTGKSRVKT